ncbi:transcriptional regulator [Pandoraea faecigallinarum]|uniref:ArsR family transcriptional regulator n=1 Tax=Pandoraea faecigallinarum TaxID=656179 RepID=A0A0H3WQB9_9BURK|nr:metalloregulator ArsR/SmtB family transcription factor [Pandoraea faecigallinarum]AKM29770.1 transcriptional regulator [Pandoraea faecigallinarum]
MPRATALSPVAPRAAAALRDDRRAAPLDIARLRAAAHDATALLRALANEDRLLILCQLTQGELSVGELEAQLDIRQPTLSQQLAVLRSEALVTTRRDGKRIYYAVADAAVLAVLACLYDQFCPQA